MKPLIGYASKYFLLAFVLAGLIYFTWHMGRKYERDHDPDVTIAECTPTNDPEYLDCILYETPPDLAILWKAIIAELSNPTSKKQLKEDYEAWDRRRSGL